MFRKVGESKFILVAMIVVVLVVFVMVMRIAPVERDSADEHYDQETYDYISSFYEDPQSIPIKGACIESGGLLPSSGYIRLIASGQRRLNEDGLAGINYGSNITLGGEVGFQLTPYTVGSFGIAAFDEWCRNGDKLALQVAYRHAEWL